MKKILNKINKKFLLIFLIFVLLECLYIFSNIFLFQNFDELKFPGFIHEFFFYWSMPAVIWFGPFFDGPFDDELWFLFLFIISAIIIPAGFWTTIIYLVTRLIKIIKKKFSKKSI